MTDAEVIKRYEHLIERQKEKGHPHSGLCIETPDLERTIKALEGYLILSENAIKSNEKLWAEHPFQGTFTGYDGNIQRFNNSYIEEIIPKLKTALRHSGKFCFISNKE